MPLLLRQIRKSRWYDDGGLPWLPVGLLPADPLSDLNTKDNKLSVWHIEDDKSNLEQVVTALAVNRDQVSNLDCALFDQHPLSGINVRIEETKGNTKDKRANIWHRELVELTAEKLLELARSIMRDGKRTRFSETRIRNLIQRAVESGIIDETKLKPNVLMSVRR